MKRSVLVMAVSLAAMVLSGAAFARRNTGIRVPNAAHATIKAPKVFHTRIKVPKSSRAPIKVRRHPGAWPGTLHGG